DRTVTGVQTCALPIFASSRADCVRGVARLISSASTICAKIGPGRNSNSVVLGLKIETPVTSVGKRSGVHCKRLNDPPIDLARAQIGRASCRERVKRGE